MAATKRICDKCKKEAGQLNLDRASKSWLCNECFYPKEVYKKKKK